MSNNSKTVKCYTVAAVKATRFGRKAHKSFHTDYFLPGMQEGE